MGVRIMSIDGVGQTNLFCSVSGIAFGPVADEDQLQEFLQWVGEKELPDLRTMPEAVLMDYWQKFVDSTGEPHEGLRVVSEEG